MDKSLPVNIYSRISDVAQPGRKRREDSPYREQAERLAIGLRSLRDRAGLTQEQLAVQAKVAVATVKKIERGTVVEPGFFTIMALLGVLGGCVEDLAT
jgi:DNA-binding XRE family transcriptional regulator